MVLFTFTVLMVRKWLIKPFGNEIVVTREHAKGDVAVRGSALALCSIFGVGIPKV